MKSAHVTQLGKGKNKTGTAVKRQPPAIKNVLIDTSEIANELIQNWQKRHLAREGIRQFKKPDGATKVFISYCWHELARREDVRQLREILHGDPTFDVWIDIKYLYENLFSELALAIDQADVVVMFYNEYYEQRPNCKREAVYTKRSGKPIVPVRTGNEPTQQWLVDAIGRKPQSIDFRLPKRSYEEVALEIRRRIKWLLNPKSKYVTVNVPYYVREDVYFNRTASEANTLQAIKRVCTNPEKGVLVIYGEGGIGKTSLVSTLLRDESKMQFFSMECQVEVVVWLNCYAWKQADEFKDQGKYDFEDKLLSLVEEKLNACYLDFRDFVQRSDNRVLLVLDDVNLIDIVHFVRDNISNNMPCCVITRDGFELPINDQRFLVHQPAVRVAQLTDSETFHMLKRSYGLELVLNDECITKLTELCCGLPLIASLVAAKFDSSSTLEHNEETYRMLIAESTKLSSSKIKGKEQAMATVVNLLEISFNLMDPILARRYMAFLFFNPQDYIPTEDLMLLWGMQSELLTLKDCKIFERKSLLRRQIGLTDFEVHQMLWDAALTFFSAQCGSGGNVTQLRDKIVSGHCCSANKEPSGINAILVSAALKQRNYLILDVIDRCSSACLVELFSARCGEALNNRVFIHYLYNLESDDVVTNTCSDPDAGLQDSKLKIPFSGRWSMKGRMFEFNMDFQKLLRGIYYNEPYWILGRFFGRLTPDENLSQLFETEDSSGVSFAMQIFDDLIESKRHISERWTVAHQISKIVLHFNILRITSMRRSFMRKISLQSAKDPSLEASISGNLEAIISKENVQIPCLPGGQTCMMTAALFGQLDAVKFFADEQRGYEAVSTANESPLIYAAYGGHPSVVSYLLEKYPDSIEAQVVDGCGALYFAVQEGNLKVVELLLPRYTGSRLLGALHTGCLLGHFQTVEYLLHHNPELARQPNNIDCYALHYVAQSGNIEMTKFVFDCYPKAVEKADTFGRFAICQAIINGDLKTTEFLFDKFPAGALRKDIFGCTPLALACCRGHLDIVEFLDQKCEDSGVQWLVEFTVGMLTCTPITAAVCFAQSHVVRYICQHHPQLLRQRLADGSTPLHFAAETCNVELIRIMHNLYPDAIKCKDQGGNVPFNRALIARNIKVMRYLAKQYPEALADGCSLAIHINSYEITRVLCETFSERLKLFSDGQSVFVTAIEVTTSADSNAFAEVANFIYGNTIQEPLSSNYMIEKEKIIRYLGDKYPHLVTAIDAHTGDSSLERAVYCNNTAAVQYISNVCPELATKANRAGVTPIATAIKRCDGARDDRILRIVIETALKNNLPLTVPNKEDGNVTLFEYAAKLGSLKACQCLAEMQGHAVLLECNTEGKTMFECAAQCGHLKVANFIYCNTINNGCEYDLRSLFSRQSFSAVEALCLFDSSYEAKLLDLARDDEMTFSVLNTIHRILDKQQSDGSYDNISKDIESFERAFFSQLACRNIVTLIQTVAKCNSIFQIQKVKNECYSILLHLVMRDDADAEISTFLMEKTFLENTLFPEIEMPLTIAPEQSESDLFSKPPSASSSSSEEEDLTSQSIVSDQCSCFVMASLLLAISLYRSASSDISSEIREKLESCGKVGISRVMSASQYWPCNCWSLAEFLLNVDEDSEACGICRRLGVWLLAASVKKTRNALNVICESDILSSRVLELSEETEPFDDSYSSNMLQSLSAQVRQLKIEREAENRFSLVQSFMQILSQIEAGHQQPSATTNGCPVS